MKRYDDKEGKKKEENSRLLKQCNDSFTYVSLLQKVETCQGLNGLIKKEDNIIDLRFTKIG